MSGTGGSGGAFAGGDETRCEDIVISTALASPDPAIKVKPGDVLLVRVRKGKTPIAVCETRKGEIVGSLVFGDVRRLITCIEKGSEYLATVTAVDGGRRQVRIAHK